MLKEKILYLEKEIASCRERERELKRQLKECTDESDAIDVRSLCNALRGCINSLDEQLRKLQVRL
jgi:polyhydroxyalkanoate synthesis regulator phasin